MRIRTTAAAVLSVSLAFISSHAYAEPGGIYYGASATLQQAEVLYEKTVRSRFGAPDRDDGEVSTSGEVSDRPLQWDGLVGYRLNFADGTQFLALQAELALSGDDISGRLEGAGTSPDLNAVGDAWPEDWSLETSRSMGAIAKYGITRSLLGTFDVSIYALAGVRQTKIDFFSAFRGCFSIGNCDPDEIQTASQSFDPEVNLLVAGAGLETGLTRKTALQFEIRYIEDFKDEWVAEFSGDNWNVEAPGGFTVQNTDFTVKLIRYL
ncbi:MAG: hypothetical protein OXG05_05025 [Gammaproteobacteria bacterium]|nr:hypothetical protein [Gammaproteobacteria bacterium]